MKPATARSASKPAAAKRTRRASRTKPAAAVRPDLVTRARALGIDTDAVIAQALTTAIAAAEGSQPNASNRFTPGQQRWLEENQEAIAWYNDFVDKHGVFSDLFREF